MRTQWYNPRDNITYKTTELSLSTTGIISFPFSSLALAMSNVASIDTILIKRDAPA
jgi:hypothetical protein